MLPVVDAIESPALGVGLLVAWVELPGQRVA
jgi:hypothetical protein